jgi:type I restriction enzyme R subunit
MSTDATQERIFQDDIITQMVANGWLEGKPDGYNRESALYEQDVLTFVKETQPKSGRSFVSYSRLIPSCTFLMP